MNGASAKPEDRSTSGWLTLAVVFAATIVAQLVSLAWGRADLERDFAELVLPSVLALSAVTLPAAGLGLALGRRIGLGAPVLEALLAREPQAMERLGRACVPAAGLGVVLGAALLVVRAFTTNHLPAELPAFGHRGVIGGLAVSIGAAVAEEVWFRLGLMTLLLWGLTRSTGHSKVRPGHAWTVILVAATAFGVAHLPQLMSYGAGSPLAIGGTVAGNVAVGALYGWSFWRHGLIAAIVAHFVVDVVLHVLPALV